MGEAGLRRGGKAAAANTCAGRNPHTQNSLACLLLNAVEKQAPEEVRGRRETRRRPVTRTRRSRPRPKPPVSVPPHLRRAKGRGGLEAEPGAFRSLSRFSSYLLGSFQNKMAARVARSRRGLSLPVYPRGARKARGAEPSWLGGQLEFPPTRRKKQLANQNSIYTRARTHFLLQFCPPLSSRQPGCLCARVRWGGITQSVAGRRGKAGNRWGMSFRSC